MVEPSGTVRVTLSPWEYVAVVSTSRSGATETTLRVSSDVDSTPSFTARTLIVVFPRTSPSGMPVVLSYFVPDAVGVEPSVV